MMRLTELMSIAVLLLFCSFGAALAAPGDLDGPFPEHGITSDVPTWWATYVVGSSQYNNPDNILGPMDTSLAVGSPQGGNITVGFDVIITNGAGSDFVVWENGFWTSYGGHEGVYAELGFVDVSTDGDYWATFPSQYLETMQPYPNIDPTYVYNLAGNYVAYYGDSALWEGTPFDLDDILDTTEVLNRLVDPNDINYVRLRDIIGAGAGGSEYDSLGNLIYDGNGFGGGADWNAVGVINAVPIPGAVWLLGSGLAVFMGLRRKNRSN
jgi:hypothetical protein